MSELMMEEVFAGVLDNIVTSAVEYGYSPDGAADKHWANVNLRSKELISAYSAALAAAAAPRTGRDRLVEACEAAVQCIEDFLEIYKHGGSMIVMDQAVKSLRDDALRLSKRALAAAKGEPAEEESIALPPLHVDRDFGPENSNAEEPWTQAREASAPDSGTLCEVRNHGVFRFVAGTYTRWYKEQPYWFNSATQESVPFKGTEWRPVREG